MGRGVKSEGNEDLTDGPIIYVLTLVHCVVGPRPP